VNAIASAIATIGHWPTTADDPNAGREPGTGRAGKPVNPKMMLRVDNDARAEKPMPVEDCLESRGCRRR